MFERGKQGHASENSEGKEWFVDQKISTAAKDWDKEFWLLSEIES
jgi:hypothetical protein